MRRRDVIAGFGGVATWPLVAGAQQAPGFPRIGLLWSLAPPSRVVDASVRLSRTSVMWTAERLSLIPLLRRPIRPAAALAAELVRLDVDVLAAAPARP